MYPQFSFEISINCFEDIIRIRDWYIRIVIPSPEPFEVTGDVLVFAGDTGYLRDRTLPNLRFWKWASANYREVLLVPGNHAFYGNGDVLA